MLAHRHAPQRDTDLLTTLLIRGGKGYVYPWLAMLRDHLTNTTDAYQLTRLRTAERPSGLIVYERLVQLNLQGRLRAPDLRVLHSPHLRRGVYGQFTPTRCQFPVKLAL